MGETAGISIGQYTFESSGQCSLPYLLTYTVVSDQVIRENPANRGTETSAEVLVGPPWRMESNAGQQQWY